MRGRDRTSAGKFVSNRFEVSMFVLEEVLVCRFISQAGHQRWLLHSHNVDTTSSLPSN